MHQHEHFHYFDRIWSKNGHNLNMIIKQKSKHLEPRISIPVTPHRRRYSSTKCSSLQHTSHSSVAGNATGAICLHRACRICGNVLSITTAAAAAAAAPVHRRFVRQGRGWWTARDGENSGAWVLSASYKHTQKPSIIETLKLLLRLRQASVVAEALQCCCKHRWKKMGVTNPAYRGS